MNYFVWGFIFAFLCVTWMLLGRTAKLQGRRWRWLFVVAFFLAVLSGVYNTLAVLNVIGGGA